MKAKRVLRRSAAAGTGWWLAVALIFGGWEARVSGQDPERRESAAAARGTAAFQWVAIPIEVEGLPKGSGSVPVSCPVDFSRILFEAGAAGAVDERTLRLDRVTPAGKAVEQPIQFVASVQPRPKRRRLLPGTTDKVSYLAEHAAGRTPPDVKVAGVLTWVVRSAPQGRARYRLRFGVARAGRLVQVPYPPHNLRGFDNDGRATPVRSFPQMQIRPLWPVRGVLHVREADAPVASYHVGPVRVPDKGDPLAIRRPFLYPVHGPDGASLTEVGKPHDPTGSHAHHRSIWIAHASIDGHDFWSQRGGIIAHDGFEAMEDGAVFCRLVQKTRWIAGGRAILRGRRSLTFYRAAADFRLIDVDLELSPAGAKPVTLGQTNFGFLAVRVAQSMTVFDGGGEILNARGDRNEQRAHTKRAAWIDQSGPVAPGKWAGVAILDHPGNANHPTAWHCRNDGWAGASFNMRGPTTIKPGEKLTLRYRLVLHRHDAVKGKVARRHEEYSARPTARFGRAGKP
jgi:hypothetical protein